MSVREFLRGGYKEPGGPIIVLNGNEVALVAFPGTSALEVRAAPVTVASNGNGHAAPVPTRPLRLTPTPSIRPVPKPGGKKK